VLEVLNFNFKRKGSGNGMFPTQESLPLPAHLDYRKLVEDSMLFKIDNPALYYDIVKQVGTGGYGKIYLVSKKVDKKYYALKFINQLKSQNSGLAYAQ
jgi:serine/threonine protein kinase